MKYCPRCQRQYPDAQRFCLSDGEILSLPDPYGLVGRILADKYRIDALVGVGGMGAVYSAHHLSLDRHVAFKILLPHLALQSPAAVGLFESEAKTAARLHHENIVQIFDAGRIENIAYITMEWLAGRGLDEVLPEEGRLSFARAAEILRQIVAALEEAHDNRTVHRDLKPSNVMLIGRRDGREQVKVLDFGIGKVLSSTDGSLVSRVMGTPAYASPEQLIEGAVIDARSDIYSLGIMLFEFLTGELPFNARKLTEMIRLQLTAPPPPLRYLRTDAPAELEELLNRMLAKQPEKRPQRSGEVMDQFNRSFQVPDQTPSAPRSEPDKLAVEPDTLLRKQPDAVPQLKIKPVQEAEFISPPSLQNLMLPEQTLPRQLSHPKHAQAKPFVIQLDNEKIKTKPQASRWIVTGAVLGTLVLIIGIMIMEKLSRPVTNVAFPSPTPATDPTPTPAPMIVSPTPAKPQRKLAVDDLPTGQSQSSRFPEPAPDSKSPEKRPNRVNVSGGVLQGSALRRVQPTYPPIAKAARAAGAVQVAVEIDEEGNVTSASVVSGHPLLRQAALDAARKWKFKPMLLSRVPIRVYGVLTFNFTLN